MNFSEDVTFEYQSRLRLVSPEWKQGNAEDFADDSGMDCIRQPGLNDIDSLTIPDPTMGPSGIILDAMVGFPVIRIRDGGKLQYLGFGNHHIEDDE